MPASRKVAVAVFGARIAYGVGLVAIPARLCRYVAEKGSIAVDGVSLTVVEVRDHPEPAFTVSPMGPSS